MSESAWKLNLGQFVDKLDLDTKNITRELEKTWDYKKENSHRF